MKEHILKHSIKSLRCQPWIEERVLKSATNGYKRFFDDPTEKIFRLREEAKIVDDLPDNQVDDYLKERFPEKNFKSKQHFINECDSRINWHKSRIYRLLYNIRDQERQSWAKEYAKWALEEDKRLSQLKDRVVA